MKQQTTPEQLISETRAIPHPERSILIKGLDLIKKDAVWAMDLDGSTYLVLNAVEDVSGIHIALQCKEALTGKIIVLQLQHASLIY